MATSVMQNIVDTCGKLGEVQLSGVKLESAASSLLDVSQLSLDQHVAMQPAAIAYYGSLKKEASRKLAVLERSYDRWQKKKYAEAKVSVESGTSAKSGIKVEDVKARFIVDNEADIIKWEAQTDKAQFEYDTMDVWYEAWKQKSFSIRETVAIDEDERYTGSGSINKRSDSGFDGGGGAPPAIKEGKIREIIRMRREREARK